MRSQTIFAGLIDHPVADGGTCTWISLESDLYSTISASLIQLTESISTFPN